MRHVQTSPYEVAMRLFGLREIAGEKDHPFIQYCFGLCDLSLETPDETPWCSAFMQYPFECLGMPRSRSARARSWLLMGEPVEPHYAEAGCDVVVLQRGTGPQPGPSVIDAPGHVGLYHAHGNGRIWLLGGNQGNEVSLAPFPMSRILAIRRIY